MVKSLNINIKYIIASIFMLVFVINDLMFDFLFNFESSDYISFMFTLLASIITFIATYNVTKNNIKNKAENISVFVMSNFNNVQVVFSVLDIVCGLISIMSGIAILGGIFKVVKIVYIPVKCVVVANKGKTLVKSVSKFSLLWTIGRLFTKRSEIKGVEKMTWIKNNKGTIASCLVLSPIGGYAGYELVSNYFMFNTVLNVLISIIIGLLVGIAVFFLGVDTVKTATFRALAKSSKDKETCNSIIDYATNVIEIANEKAEAEARVIAEEKTKSAEETKVQDTVKAQAEAEKEERIKQYMAEFKAKRDSGN